MSTTLLTMRLRAESSPETILQTTEASVLAMIPTAQRVPDEVRGSCYGRIADGEIGLGEAVVRMDASCVVHSAFAERWLRHVRLERAGFRAELVAWAELMDLVDAEVCCDAASFRNVRSVA